MTSVYQGAGQSHVDASVVAALYQRYASWLKARIVKLYGRQEADELLQETWLRLSPYEATGEIRHPKALLLRIARNIAIDRSRQAEVARSHAFAHPAPDRAEADQLDDLIAREAILSLPDDLRDVFVLNRVVGLTYAEVAAHTGLSLKTVEWRLSRALIHCASQLRR